MNPIYTARIARAKAERAWREVDRDPASTTQQRSEARKAYEQSKSNYRAAFKEQRNDKP
jgi:hypothetical protein